MLEILSPAGSPEGVIAAVQNGADAVYLGFGDFNARRNAKNFSIEEFERALEYCRVRGVKTHLTLNTLASDRELPEAAEYAKTACRLGIDAIIVQDLGVMMAVRQSVPDVPVHASTQMGIHNLEGVKMAAAMGIKRVVIARELSRKELAHICRNSPIEIEVFVHGALCMCYSGQCYMSAIIGRRSGNRGLCAQPCRLSYSIGGHAAKHPLSLKDNCLVRYMADLESVGVAAVKIEGRMKRPEYSAIVTGIYSKAAHKGKAPTADDMHSLQKAFSRQGFTDGYYNNRKDSNMLGIREEDSKADSVIFTTARKNYLNGEFQRVPVRFVGKISEGKRVKLAAADDRGNTSVVYGPIPEPAFHKELTAAALQTQLHRTGGTPFFCAGVKSSVEPGLALPISAFNAMRRNLLADILEQRKAIQARPEGAFIPMEPIEGRNEPPVLTVSVMRADQLSADMVELRPHIVYLPVMELDFESPVIRSILESEDISIAAMLPRVMHDNEKKKVSEVLVRAMERGVTDALVGNIGHIMFARSHGMDVRGDFGLNVFNSETLKVLRDLKLKSATLSFEMRLAEIRDMKKPLDTEIIVYGRLPLMITENCIVKNSTGVCTCENFSGLEDSTGALFPVAPDFGCRNVLLNSKKLFMADKRRATALLGLWAERLSFTTENSVECVAVMKRYLGVGDYEPSGYTRGLYYRGVE
ncbi:MAG: U32 family peptidase [Oscillospiraceae bacterium]|jgi:putative protease|nr:U32 family peptidase [Oscillospiraceae bacterium]